MEEYEIERAVRKVFRDYFAESSRTSLIMLFSKKYGDRDLAQSIERMRKRVDKIRLNTSIPDSDFLYLVTIISEEENFRDAKWWPRTKKHSNKRFLLSFMLSEIELEVLEGDLIELYTMNAARLGKRRAKWIVYRQIVISLWPFIKRRLNNLSAIIWVSNFVRRRNL